MSNNDLLTAEEFESYSPSAPIIRRIEACRARFGVPRARFRILDWGCGRGTFVLWLREQGYDAGGVDVDARPFANGAEVFARKGLRSEECLFCLDDDGTAPFPDAAFDMVTSWQTLEHIEDLESVASQLHRVTRNGGEGVHVFPPHRRIMEPHLFMPFVHWLPKNRLRRQLIATFVRAGVEPNWWPDGNMDRRRKVDVYYRYSVDETFYRPPGTILRCFHEAGFDAELEGRHTNLAADVCLVTIRR